MLDIDEPYEFSSIRFTPDGNRITYLAAGEVRSASVDALGGTPLIAGVDLDRSNQHVAARAMLTGDTHQALYIVPIGGGGLISGTSMAVKSINPNQVLLQNVGTGGKGANSTKKMVMIVQAVDAPGVTCDPGEFSNPTPVNLKMEDDRGNILIDSAKTIVCGPGVTKNVTRNVFFRGPLHCENGAVPPPKPDFSLGTITSTGSAPGTANYVEGIGIKCFE